MPTAQAIATESLRNPQRGERSLRTNNGAASGLATLRAAATTHHRNTSSTSRTNTGHTANRCNDKGSSDAVGDTDTVSVRVAGEPFHAAAPCRTDAYAAMKHMDSRADDWVGEALSQHRDDRNTRVTNASPNEVDAAWLRQAYRLHLHASFPARAHTSRSLGRGEPNARGGVRDASNRTNPAVNNHTSPAELLFYASPRCMNSEELQRWQRIACSATAREVCVQSVMGRCGPTLVGWSGEKAVLMPATTRTDAQGGGDDGSAHSSNYRGEGVERAGADSRKDNEASHSCLWRGIANLRNTCYLNVVMQLLFAVAPVRRAILAAAAAEDMCAHEGGDDTDCSRTHCDDDEEEEEEDGNEDSDDYKHNSLHKNNHASSQAVVEAAKAKAVGKQTAPVPDGANAATSTAVYERSDGGTRMMNLTNQTLAGCGMAELFAEMAYRLTRRGADAGRLARSLQMDVTTQEDAHECLLRLLDWFRHHCGAHLSTTINRTFGWKLLYDRCCSGCGRSVKRTELFYTIALPAKATLGEAVESFLQPEEVPGAMCEGCGQSCGMVSRQYLRTLPSVLLIHVHHMPPCMTSVPTRSSKSSTSMRIPFRLDMTPYMRAWHDERHRHVPTNDATTRIGNSIDDDSSSSFTNSCKESSGHGRSMAARHARANTRTRFRTHGEGGGVCVTEACEANTVRADAPCSPTARATPSMTERYHYELRGVIHHHGSSSRGGHYTYTGKVAVPDYTTDASAARDTCARTGVRGWEGRTPSPPPAARRTHVDPTRKATCAATSAAETVTARSNRTVWLHFNDATVSEAAFMNASSMLPMTHTSTYPRTSEHHATMTASAATHVNGHSSSNNHNSNSVTLPGVYLLVYHRVTSSVLSLSSASPPHTTLADAPCVSEFSPRLQAHVGAINAAAVTRRRRWLQRRDGLRVLLREWGELAQGILTTDDTLAHSPRESGMVYAIPADSLRTLARCFLPTEAVWRTRLCELEDDTHATTQHGQAGVHDDECDTEACCEPANRPRATRQASAHTETKTGRMTPALTDAAADEVWATQRPPYHASSTSAAAEQEGCAEQENDYNKSSHDKENEDEDDAEHTHMRRQKMRALAAAVGSQARMPLPPWMLCTHGKLAPWAPFKLLSAASAHSWGKWLSRVLAWAVDDEVGESSAASLDEDGGVVSPAALVPLSASTMCVCCARALATRLQTWMQTWPIDVRAMSCVQPLTRRPSTCHDGDAGCAAVGLTEGAGQAGTDGCAAREENSVRHDTDARVHVSGYVVALWERLMRTSAVWQSVWDEVGCTGVVAGCYARACGERVADSSCARPMACERGRCDEPHTRHADTTGSHEKDACVKRVGRSMDAVCARANDGSSQQPSGVGDTRDGAGVTNKRACAGGTSAADSADGIDTSLRHTAHTTSYTSATTRAGVHRVAGLDDAVQDVHDRHTHTAFSVSAAPALCESRLDAGVYAAVCDVMQRLRHGVTGVRDTVCCEHGGLPVRVNAVHLPHDASFRSTSTTHNHATRYTIPEWVRLHWIRRLTALCRELYADSVLLAETESFAEADDAAGAPARHLSSSSSTHAAQPAHVPAWLSESRVTELLLPRVPVLADVAPCRICAERERELQARRRRRQMRCVEELSRFATLTAAAAETSAAAVTSAGTSASTCLSCVAPEKHVNVTRYFAVEDSAATYAEALRVWREEQDVKVFQRRGYVEQLTRIVQRQQQQQQRQSRGNHYSANTARMRGRGGGGGACYDSRGRAGESAAAGQPEEDSPAGRLARAQAELQHLITQPAPMLERRWGCVPSWWVRRWYAAVRRVQAESSDTTHEVCDTWMMNRAGVERVDEIDNNNNNNKHDNANEAEEEQEEEECVPAVPSLQRMCYDRFVCPHGGSLLELSWLDPTSAFWRSGRAKHVALLWKCGTSNGAASTRGDNVTDDGMPRGDAARTTARTTTMTGKLEPNVHETTMHTMESSTSKSDRTASQATSGNCSSTQQIRSNTSASPHVCHSNQRREGVDNAEQAHVINANEDEDENDVCDWVPPLVLVPMSEYTALVQRYGLQSTDGRPTSPHQPPVVPAVVERFGVRSLEPPPCSTCIQQTLASAQRRRDRFEEGTVVVQLHLRRSKKQFYDATGVIGGAEDAVRHDMTLAALRGAIAQHIAREHHWRVPAEELQITRVRGKPLRRRGAVETGTLGCNNNYNNNNNNGSSISGSNTNSSGVVSASLEEATLYELDVHDGDTLEVNLWETKVQPCVKQESSIAAAAAAASAPAVDVNEEVWQDIPPELLISPEQRDSNDDTAAAASAAVWGTATASANTTVSSHSRANKGGKKKRHATTVSLAAVSTVIGEAESVACPVCTYLNAKDMVVCEMCESVLPQS